MRATGTEMGAAIASLHERNGTTLLCDTGVKAIEGESRVERVVLSDGTILAGDLVVVGMGVSPYTEWLEGLGPTLDNGFVCDETPWAGVQGVHSAGDVANWINPMVGLTSSAHGELDGGRRARRGGRTKRTRPRERETLCDNGQSSDSAV